MPVRSPNGWSKQKLLGEERRREILRILENENRVTVDDLVRRFGVSAVTGRADLDMLAGAGALVRSHGGAVRRLEGMPEYPMSVKAGMNAAEKVRIAQAAAKLVGPDQTILLDSGTTTVHIARQLKALRIKPLTVITNALNIAQELSGAPGISLIMLGGILLESSDCFIGPHAERMLADLHADHLFLAVDGFDPELGASTQDILEAQLNALMVRQSNQTTVVADATKLGRRSMSLIAPIGSVRRLVTDDRIDREFAANLRRHHLEVIAA